MSPRIQLQAAVLAAGLGVLIPVASLAQTSPDVPEVREPYGVPVDTTGLSRGPYGVMEMLYEVTILNIDVFTVRLEVGDAEAERLRARAEHASWSRETEERLAEEVLGARNALLTTRFHRDVGLDRFLGGMEDNFRRVREAGLITREEERALLAEARTQYEVLRGRGIRDGDLFWYRIRGDSLHVFLQDRTGATLGESRGEGSANRLALLGNYFAPGTDFRQPLLRSLVPER